MLTCSHPPPHPPSPPFHRTSPPTPPQPPAVVSSGERFGRAARCASFFLYDDRTVPVERRAVVVIVDVPNDALLPRPPMRSERRVAFVPPVVVAVVGAASASRTAARNSAQWAIGQA